VTVEPSLALSLWVRLMKIHSLILNDVRKCLKGRCTLPQFDVMVQLHRAPSGLTFREISRRLLVSAGNLTGIVDRLAAEGLARREIVAHDRRSFRILLTPRGRRLMARLLVIHRGDLERILSPVPEAQQSALRTLLGSAARRLEEGHRDVRTPGPEAGERRKRAGGSR
jgi:DNA-binding MarR family transcriptional regulator